MIDTLRSDPAVRRALDTVITLLAGRRAYLVGGSIRDALLRRPLADLDLAVDADASELARAVADALGGHYVPLDDERGVARAVLDGGLTMDVARLRGGDIGADLALRDFTIDAMAAPLDALGDIIDPFDGRADLDRHLVRLVSEQALVDDPLRLLRGVRLAAQLEFDIDVDTMALMRTHASRINEASPERQRDEIALCFATDRARRALALLDQAGLLDLLFPEVAVGRGVQQPGEYHYYDVFEHNLETVAALDFMLVEEEPSERAEFWSALWQSLRAAAGDSVRDYLRVKMSDGRSRRTMLKLAGLLHDVAKPETRKVQDDGRIRFFGHAEIGAETARAIFQRLRFSRREAGVVSTLVDQHLRPTQLGEFPPTRRALFRFFRDTGEGAEGVLLLSLADAFAARGPGMDLKSWRGYVAFIAHVLSRRHQDESIARPERLLTGDDIMSALNVEPGPVIGRLLSALEEAQAAGEVQTRDQAFAFVRSLTPAGERR